jgi:outer membrane biosynthesis protein TonB
MWLRKILIVAAVVAPLAWSPLDASAQNRGQAQAQAARAANPSPEEMPEGLANAFAGRTAPEALLRRFPQPEPEPVVEPEPEPEPEPDPPAEECATWLVMVNGVPSHIEDCHGNEYPLP